MKAAVVRPVNGHDAAAALEEMAALEETHRTLGVVARRTREEADERLRALEEEVFAQVAGPMEAYMEVAERTACHGEEYDRVRMEYLRVSRRAGLRYVMQDFSASGNAIVKQCEATIAFHQARHGAE